MLAKKASFSGPPPLGGPGGLWVSPGFWLYVVTYATSAREVNVMGLPGYFSVMVALNLLQSWHNRSKKYFYAF